MAKNGQQGFCKRNVSGNCQCEIKNGNVITLFESGASVHSFTYALEQAVTIDSFDITIQLSDWEEISYLAVGIENEGNFEHIKVAHVRQNLDFLIRFSTSDIYYLIQNNEIKQQPFELKKVKVFVKGKASNRKSKIVLSSLRLNEKPEQELSLDNFTISSELETYLFEHMKKCFRDYKEQANIILYTGGYPMPGGQKLIWPASSKYPVDLDSVNTYRFSWHAMHVAICLLIVAREERCTEALYMAKNLISSWLQDNYFQESYDMKFAWYDHGTSERLICFLMLLSFADSVGFDVRFSGQISEAISAHITLLSHEGFYAYNQRERYHNHAWFQDIALLLSGLCFPKETKSISWQALAIERLQDQIQKLIVRDGGYSVFVENSIDYHQGIQRICFFAGQLVGLSDIPNDIARVSNELDKWSRFFCYPNGRTPSQGDSFRLPAQTGDKAFECKSFDKQQIKVLQKAGYAVVKGNFDNLPYVLCFYATALSDTHKHEDNLSFTFFFDGVEWFIDPSFYSHEYDQPIPRFLRSAWAHNTVAITGEAFSIKPGNVKIDSYKINEDKLTLKGSSTGYKQKISRKLETDLNNGSFSFQDKVCNLESKAYQMLHMCEKVKVSEKDSELLLTHPDSQYQLKISLHGRKRYEITNKFIEGVDIKAIVGLGFMQKEPSSVCAIELSQTGANKVSIKIERIVE